MNVAKPVSIATLRRRAWRKDNRDKINGYNRSYYQRNKEKFRDLHLGFKGRGFRVQHLDGRVISTTAIVKGKRVRVQVWIP